MMHSVQRLCKCVGPDEGSSLVEYSLACSVFFAMLIGISQMSLAFYTLDYVCDAAREGSRYAMVRGSNSCTNTPNLTNCNVTSDQVQSYVRGIAYPGIVPAQLTVTTTWQSATITQSTTTWSAC